MMAKPPIGKVVERLESGGWITRRDDDKDRRAKLVRLTPKIQPMLNSLESLVDDIGGIATRGMSKKEAAQFYKLIKLAHANLMAEN